MKNKLKDLFMKNKLTPLLSIFVLFVLLIFAQNSALAQGRGRGNAGGAGNSGVNRPGNPNVGFGQDNASRRSNGRSGEGLERARPGRENARRAESEVRNNPHTAKLLGTNANDLRQSYQAALNENPDLKFGQFVAANMLARNLGSRYPNITTAAILDGLAEGDSIGRTLKNLGVSSNEVKDAEHQAKEAAQEIKNRQ
ncbi:MAG: hypothetical protein H0W58_04955 [Acidobacteria bacterium]|nr:hypothetical protein [Acidobacteriota bacterium]